MTGRIHSVESFGTLDGPGVRYVVFFQGCPLRCVYCHNPDTWNPDQGRKISVEELMAQIESYRSFIRTGGVTLSGGEPLMQIGFATELLNACKKRGFHTALDTAGSIPLDISHRAIEKADLILLDIKALDPALCIELTGTDNRWALKTLEYCERIGKPVWIRHVLVPGLTLVRSHLEELAAFLKHCQCVERVEVLPYHRMGAFKWRELGLAQPLGDTPEPTGEERKMAEAILEKKLSE